ncbi:hypothetical protein [Arenibacter latericius]|uniref:hypothetical protein n=1 Tax=Arenibacter latericius TaxID=86104 RepID=UPI0005577130|nr:hypothetical protein [Arenibacter latericius]MDX1362919.1 hypothetical protein [Arenibacter latericius]
MISFREHILPLLSILMVALFALPGGLKAKHAILEHHTFVCKEKGKLHVHEVELECEFHKFNISHFVFPEFSGIDDPIWTVSKIKIVDYYQFLSKYQDLHFSLRGPPSLI